MRWKALFPKFQATLPQIVHPTAVYEDDKGDLFTLLINGKQPKSSTDLFILWQLRIMSTVIVQSGKTLRDEPKAMEYA